MLQISLEIPLGIDSDTSSMGATGAADLNNVRPWHGGWQTIGGYAAIANLQNLAGGTVRAIFGMMRGSFLNLFYATSQKLWRGQSFGVPTDVTPASTPSSTTTAWSLQAWGGTSSAVLAAREVLGGAYSDPTGGSTYFHNEVVGSPESVGGFFGGAYRGDGGRRRTLGLSPYRSPNDENFFYHDLTEPPQPVLSKQRRFPISHPDIPVGGS